MDFVRLPYQQYQEDGRLVWGIQRGTTALTSSTGVAVVELTSQLLETIQGLAQMAYDMVSPPQERQDQQPSGHQHRPYQPLDFREGFSNAYDLVYDVRPTIEKKIPSVSVPCCHGIEPHVDLCIVFSVAVGYWRDSC
jgi:hypothetical protein